ncbi:MAG: hypothetical protein H6774_04145 [Pseudomonadales bacterium]|nr:hypothetical protein [Candidatus Woesebacteria bacterium]MCB9802252.1 hypothetical protein [Pseudomonadales bacterium]
MTKYKAYYQKMETEHQELFDRFEPIHDAYKADRSEAEAFHAIGGEVVAIMREWEQRLCAGMERGKHAQYSRGVSEKFWNEIKQRFSHIELVGVTSTFQT